MTTGYGRGSGFLPRPPVTKDRHSETWHKREERVAQALKPPRTKKAARKIEEAMRE